MLTAFVDRDAEAFGRLTDQHRSDLQQSVDALRGDDVLFAARSSVEAAAGDLEANFVPPSPAIPR